MAGDPFHLEPLEGRRQVVLSDVIWGGFFREIVEHVWRQPIRKMLRQVATVVGVGAGLALALRKRGCEHLRRACLWGGPNRGVYPRGGTIWRVARGAGADRKDLLGARSIEREFDLEHLGTRAAFALWRKAEFTLYNRVIPR